MNNQCSACGANAMNIFYALDNVPVHSVRLLHAREEALQFPTGKMNLAHCSKCGFISNISYDPDLQDYSAEYESTQAYSPTFNSFAHKLAAHLVVRYDLHQKEIIEIGCGQGEFISLLCELGDNHGTGFDPAYTPDRSAVRPGSRVDIVPDYFSEVYSDRKADFICCKMTLEHIRDVASFVGDLRRSIGDRMDTIIFFQVPDVARVLKEVAFWDIYYEHCSYFSMGALARLFRSQGFEVRDLWRDYGDQYLMIDARPAEGVTSPLLPQENDLEPVANAVNDFTRWYPLELERWRQTVRGAVEQGEKVVVWGSGSKGVAFLTTLGVCEEIEYTVDVNPNKHGTFMTRTGQQVVSPAFLEDYKPDLVILMNPLYRQEVIADLRRRGLSPRILSIGE